MRKTLLAPIIPIGHFSYSSLASCSIDPFGKTRLRSMAVCAFISIITNSLHSLWASWLFKDDSLSPGTQFQDVQIFLARLIQCIFLHCCRFLCSPGPVLPSSAPVHSLQVSYDWVFYTHLCSPVGPFVSLSHGDHISTCENACIAPAQWTMKMSARLTVMKLQGFQRNSCLHAFSGWSQSVDRPEPNQSLSLICHF